MPLKQFFVLELLAPTALTHMELEAKLLPDADALAQPPAHASGAGVREQCAAIEKTRQRLRLGF